MSERFILPTRLDSSGAAPLVDALMLRRGRALVVDAAGVEVIGALALEVIVAAARQWQADGQPFAIVDPSDRFRSSCEALGLNAEAPWMADSATGFRIEVAA